MPGASKATRRVKVINANWTPPANGGDGRFDLMLVTDDDEKHVVSPSAADLGVLLALTKEDNVVLWDPVNRTLIVANIIGSWLPREQEPAAG